MKKKPRGKKQPNNKSTAPDLMPGSPQWLRELSKGFIGSTRHGLVNAAAVLEATVGGQGIEKYLVIAATGELSPHDAEIATMTVSCFVDRPEWIVNHKWLAIRCDRFKSAMIVPASKLKQ